jgi:hypothetical protein
MSICKVGDVGHYQYLNRHNQPEARLIRTHAVVIRPRTCRLLSAIGNVAATMLCMPVTVAQMRRTSVDGITNGVEVKIFVDNFTSQARNQITLVTTVIIANENASTYYSLL